MSDDKVSIDREFRPQQRAQNRRRLRRIGVVAMAAAALGLGWLLRSPTSDTPEQIGSDTLPLMRLTDPAVSPQVAISNVPLGEVVPGFVDTLTALTWGNDGVEILRWRASEPAPETMMSLAHDDGGWNRSVDASGRWLVEIRGDSALTVYPVSDARPRAPQLVDEMSGVRAWSAMWHDTRPGRLAWLACRREVPGSAGSLYITDMTNAAEPVALPLADFPCEDSGVWLTRWGDWGMLLQTAEGTGTVQVLLNTDGAEVARGRLGPEGEWFVGVGWDGTTVWTEGLGIRDSSSFLLSADGRRRTQVPGLAFGERLESALGSPDGSLLALLPDLTANYGSVVRIVEAGTGSVLAELAEPSWWVTRMVWSADSRFLIYERWPDVTSNWAGVPQDVELVFYDTEANSRSAVPLPSYATALRSRP